MFTNVRNETLSGDVRISYLSQCFKDLIKINPYEKIVYTKLLNPLRKMIIIENIHIKNWIYSIFNTPKENHFLLSGIIGPRITARKMKKQD